MATRSSTKRRAEEDLVGEKATKASKKSGGKGEVKNSKAKVSKKSYQTGILRLMDARMTLERKGNEQMTKSLQGKTPATPKRNQFPHGKFCFLINERPKKCFRKQ